MRFCLQKTNLFGLIFGASLALVLLCVCSSPAWADVEQLINQGKEAIDSKKYSVAEEKLTQALLEDPQNPRVMYLLAITKNALKKYKEAEELADRILAMPVSNAWEVKVYYKGKTEPEEAQLVDAIVLPPQRTANNMRNYLDIKGNDPIPQYRLYFKSTGQMQLVPQSLVRLEYTAVLRRNYEEVKLLKNEIRKNAVAAGGSKGGSEMVELKGGCLKMGFDQGLASERPAHEVCLSPFKIDKYEVTQAEFQKVMGSNPSQYVGADLPVDSITWYEADEFCRKVGKRLPTEAEWEYAARGGTDSHFYWGNTVKGKEANFCDTNCSLNIRVAAVDDGYPTTAPVGKFPPNPYGLYDMAGNLAEWTADWMDESYYISSPKDNPKGPRPMPYKVARGGGWNTTAGYLRSSNRASYEPGYRNPGVGFRCAADM